ncbi:MAG TPA: hypothetical protein VNF49_07510 [Candidatus Binataceae bacterium]|nr:hypothetical protein [Candidatus Binataceae bacterium]
MEGPRSAGSLAHIQWAGTHPTICDHYCGLGHNSMKTTIMVQ